MTNPGAGNGPGEVQGKRAGPNQASGAVVPISSVIGSYQAQATQALSSMAVPPSLRDLVRAYFDRLANPEPDP